MENSDALSSAVGTIYEWVKDIRDRNISLDATYLQGLKTNIVANFFKESSAEDHLSALIEAHRNEDLVLVLGAGVSAGHNLPTWTALLQRLLLNAFDAEKNSNREKSQVLSRLFTELFPSSPLIAGRYLSTYYADSAGIGSESFEEAVRKALYEGLGDLQNSDIFNEIRQLCTAPGKSPNLDSIITYNYDDILEQYLSKSNVEIQFKSIHAIGMHSSHHELPIYHVHGFLPRNGILGSDHKITLSDDIYHRQYNDIYSWSNMVQINKFRDKTCLFAGISFTDPNLRRLLDIAKSQKGDSTKAHYIFRKRYDKSAMSTMLSRILYQDDTLLSAKGAADLRFDETIEALVDMAEEFEENDALSFGVKTIWVDNFEQIPQELKKIRKGV